MQPRRMMKKHACMLMVKINTWLSGLRTNFLNLGITLKAYHVNTIYVLMHRRLMKTHGENI